MVRRDKFFPFRESSAEAILYTLEQRASILQGARDSLLDSTDMSEAMKLARMPRAQQDVFLMTLSPKESRVLAFDWKFWARKSQLTPGGDWYTWLLMAGRGFGKSRVGSEWTREKVYGDSRNPLNSSTGIGRIALIAETAADARDVIVQGDSGILATSPPDFRPRYVKSDRKLEWPNGAIALLYSSEEPDQLRGPQFHAAWMDELAKYRHATEVYDQLQFGMRLGNHPQQIITTTPRPIPIIRRVLAEEGKLGGTVVSRGGTFDNAANLAPTFIRQMKEKYSGTRLGRQELYAEILDDVPDALWNSHSLEVRTSENPLAAGMSAEEIVRLPHMRRIVVGVDPSGSRNTEDSSDDVGIVAMGVGVDGIFYVLDDSTSSGGPDEWATAVMACYRRNQADVIIGEENFGGALVEHAIRTKDRRAPYKAVRASRGKVIRAEPIAMLYEQGRVRHVGQFAELEDQMCSMGRSGYVGRGSPDRLDAMVWCATELLMDPMGSPVSGTMRN